MTSRSSARVSQAFALLFCATCVFACSDKTTGGGADASAADASSNGGADASLGSDAASPDGGSPYCSADAQCMMGQTCVSGAIPGGTTPFGCGAQPQDTCTTDGDCADAGGSGGGADGGSLVCIAASGCTGSHCGPGCTGDTDCGFAQACKLSHCVVKPCTGDAECPTNYSCQSSTCAVKPCTQDSDCKGYCVDAFCAADPGGCTRLVGVP